MAKTMNRQKNLGIGVPCECDLEFARRYTIKDASKNFSVELPGGVLNVSRHYFGAVVPMMKLVASSKDEKGERVAILQFAEKNKEETSMAISSIQKLVRRADWQGFKIIVTASGMSFAEVLTQASQGKFGRTSPSPVEMRVSVDVKGKKQSVISAPIAALMAGVPGVSEDTLDYEDFWGLYFACHSHWYSDPTGRHFTVCHGPCSSGGPCSCGGGARTCWGWHFCWC